MTRQPKDLPEAAAPAGPTVFRWPVDRHTFDKQRDRLETDEGCVKARQCILKTIKESFFGRYDDPATALASASEELTYLAYATVVRAGPDRATYEKHWTEETGKSWKAVKEFPAQIKRMADEIERINGSPLLAFKQHVNLAASMRLYAGALGRRVNTILRRHALADPYAGPIYYLTYTVKDWTGKYRDSEVAKLLNAAAAALDKEGRMYRRYDALNLAQARSRRGKTQKT